ncbi:MAG: D-alanine--D-alanine ligase [Acidobacteria bacterium]|nr:MAG: D-alanine--D-alanine ligase [Acidobacteriota bacterium]
MRITILYDIQDEEDGKRANGEQPAPVVCQQVEDVLTKRGHEAKLLAASDNIRTLASQIDKDNSDLIFNLCESLKGISQYEQNVASLLEVLGKRFTGAEAFGLALAQDKALSKKIFHFHGIRYPKFSLMRAGRVDYSDELDFPLIVKPANEDSSIGIDGNAIVRNLKDLMERISYIHTEFNTPVLIEEFIEGRELYIGVLGNDKPEALPILEWDFSSIPDDFPKIATNEAKWDEDSVYKQAPEVFPNDIPGEVVQRIQEDAVNAFKLLHLRDYGRVDMRLFHDAKTDEWRNYIIEVNPNPYLEKKSELAMSARKHGLSYPDLVEKIAQMAFER